LILLNDEAKKRFAHLKDAPTHAYCNHRSVSHAPGIPGITDLRASYLFGTLDASGNFLVNPHCGTFSADLPKRGIAPKDDAEKATWKTLIANVFSVGSVPDPANPTKTIAVAAKKDRADCKVCDIDAVMSHVYEELAGTVVPYSGF
jgi:hypothetical protein